MWPIINPTSKRITELEAKNMRLRDALEEYAVHDSQCILSQGHAGRPTDDGDYETKFGDKWYRRDKWPECTCGLSAVLSEGEE